MPVNSPARAGVLLGAEVYALRNRCPSCAGNFSSFNSAAQCPVQIGCRLKLL